MVKLQQRKTLIPVLLNILGLVLLQLPTDPMLQYMLQLLSFFCLVIGFGWLYTTRTRIVESNPQLKLLDWGLIALITCLAPIFGLLGLPILFWFPVIFCSLGARLSITQLIKRKRS